MDLKEIGINTRNWVDSAQDRDYRRKNLKLIGYKNIKKGRSFIFISLFSIIIFNNFLALFFYVITPL